MPPKISGHISLLDEGDFLGFRSSRSNVVKPFMALISQFPFLKRMMLSGAGNFVNSVLNGWDSRKVFLDSPKL